MLKTALGGVVPRYFRCVFFCLVSLLAALVSPGSILYARNKVITHGYDWEFIATGRFEVYYYGQGGRNLLPYVRRDIDLAYDRVTRVLPRAGAERFPIFLYNTHNDFEESNIADIGEGTGGVTEGYKNRLIVGNTGSLGTLQYLFNHEMAHEIEFSYLFGGFWRSIRLLKFVIYPNWLMEGLAEYVTGDLDRTTREMYLRDAATTGRLLPLEQLHGFNHVLPHQVTLAYKESDAFMRYLAAEYGEETLPRALDIYQDSFDASAVLLRVAGADLPTLDRRFREYLEDRYAIEISSLNEPSAYGKKLTESGPYPRFCEGAVFSPDGKKLAFLSDESGQPEVFLRDMATGATERLAAFSRLLDVEYIHTEGWPVSFSPDGRYLAVCGSHRQRDYIFVLDLQERVLRRIQPGTETAVSPAFSPDGGIIYFSGIRNGFRDLYAWSRKTGELRQLTATPGDDIDALPWPDGKSLVYATERPGPSGRMEYDICRLDLTAMTTAFLVAVPGDERYASPAGRGENFYFTSDVDGIRDIYEKEIGRDGMRRLTRVAGGNFQPRSSPDGASLVFSSFRNGERQLYQGALPVPPSGGPGVAQAVESSTAAIRGAPTVYETVSSTSNAGPYRFRGSTDLFFPALYYSSLDGLYLAAYWQWSELTGNQVLQAVADYASGSQYLNYQLIYGFLKYRPQFYVSASGSEYYYDYERTIYRQENQQMAATLYPLNRFQAVELMLETIDRTERQEDHPELNSRRRENVLGLVFLHDTRRGVYLEALEGGALRLETDFSARVLSGDYSYQNYMAELQRLVPLGGYQTLSLRAFAGVSSGADAEFFRLGGLNRLRGVPDDSRYEGHRVGMAQAEWRFPLMHNTNYHLWFIFPDFFFKTIYGDVFVDAGFTANNDAQLRYLTADYWQGSYGAGLRIHTFLLQSYTLMINFQIARPFSPAGTVYYLSFGTVY